MRFNIKVKQEIRKTFWRNLKKQKHSKFFNSYPFVKFIYSSYNAFPSFFKKHLLGLNKKSVSNLTGSELGTVSILNLWFKTYIFKKY